MLQEQIRAEGPNHPCVQLAVLFANDRERSAIGEL